MRRFNIQINYNDIDKYYDDLVRLPIYFVDNKTKKENKLNLKDLIPIWMINKLEYLYFRKGHYSNYYLTNVIIGYINNWFNRDTFKICYLNYGYKIEAYVYNDINVLNSNIKFERKYNYPNLTIENFDLKNRLQFSYDFI